MRTVAAVLAVSAVLLAQKAGEVQLGSSPYTPRAPFALQVETRLVEVGVVVRDPRGHPVGGLKREDFTLEDAGKRREISAFAVETNTPDGASATGSSTEGAAMAAPRMLALLFDDISMAGSDLAPAKAAATLLVRKGLAPGDVAAVFTISGGQSLAFTRDPEALAAAIKGVTLHARALESGSCPVLTAFDAYQMVKVVDPSVIALKTAEAIRCMMPPREASRMVLSQAEALWNEVHDVSARTLLGIGTTIDSLGRLPGQRTLLLASAGFMAYGLEQEEDEIAARALHTHVVIHALDAKGLFTAESAAPSTSAGSTRAVVRAARAGVQSKDLGDDPLGYMAESTGGLFFHNNNDLEQGMRDLGMRPEVSYLLGFPPDAKGKGEYHRLKVTVKLAGGYSLQMRPGYFAVPAEAPKQTVERRIDREVLESTTLAEIPAQLSAAPIRLDNGQPAVLITTHLDVREFPFKVESKIRTQKLTVIALAYDAEGKFVAGKEGRVQFAISEATFQQFLESGFSATMALPVAAGKYRIRVALQDVVEGKIVSAAQSVEVH